MKRFQWLGRLLFGVVLVAVGLFILLGEKESFVRILMFLLGALAVISGIVSVASMARYGFGKFNHAAVTVKGVVAIIVGVLAMIMPLATAYTTWRIFIYVLAAQMTLTAIVAFLEAAAIRSKGFDTVPLIHEALVSMVIAVVLFLFPNGIGHLLLVIMGIAVMLVGAVIIGLAVHSRPKRDTTTIHDVKVEVVSEPEKKDQ